MKLKEWVAELTTEGRKTKTYVFALAQYASRNRDGRISAFLDMISLKAMAGASVAFKAGDLTLLLSHNKSCNKELASLVNTLNIDMDNVQLDERAETELKLFTLNFQQLINQYDGETDMEHIGKQIKNDRSAHKQDEEEKDEEEDDETTSDGLQSFGDFLNGLSKGDKNVDEPSNSIDSLRKKLNVALKNEDYETAAKIRDEINKSK